MFEHCERRTTSDAGPWVYSKLTYAPLNSGELKRQCNEEETAADLQTECPRSVGFWQGFAGLKVKVPAIPRGLGVVTNDWCINVNIRHLPCSAALWEAI